MTEVIILGQAPARSGDGRPFTGPSGRRLCQLLGLPHYDSLKNRFTLQNLTPRPVHKLANGRGDTFDRLAAKASAELMVREWARSDEPVAIIACGHAVFNCVTHESKPFFKGKKIGLRHIDWDAEPIEVWCFPHPSGASAFWNDQHNWLEARQFLMRLSKRYGIELQ